MKTFFSLLLIFSSALLSAQTFTVVADSLRLPNGLEVDAQGRLWVVESGYGFDDGAVSIIQPDGSVVPVVVGLPAFFDTSSMESIGPWHSLLLPNDQLAVTSGASGQVLTFSLAGFTPGVSAPLTAASSTSAIDVFGYAIGQGLVESNAYSLAHDGSGNLYIADAAANYILKATPGGQLSVFASFPDFANPLPVGPPMVNAVPTRVLARPGGGFFVCQLTGFPFPEGGASVYAVDANGTVSTYAGGLTMLTDLALDANTGDLFALQIGLFDLATFNFAPNSAKVHRLRPDGTREVTAENFDLSPGMALDGQGNLYVTELASGRVLKMDGVATGAHSVDNGLTGFSISPNPATDFLRIDFSLKNASSVQIRVLDAQGRMVFAQNTGMLEAGVHQTVWQAASQPAGLYWVDVQTAMGTKTQKLILQH